MKEKDHLHGTTDEVPPENIPRDTTNGQLRAKDDSTTKEETKNSRDMQDRPRKSYEHDGPGGGYTGF